MPYPGDVQCGKPDIYVTLVEAVHQLLETPAIFYRCKKVVVRQNRADAKLQKCYAHPDATKERTAIVRIQLIPKCNTMKKTLSLGNCSQILLVQLILIMDRIFKKLSF